MKKTKAVIFLIVAVLIGLSAYAIYTVLPISTAQKKESFMRKIDAKQQEIYNHLRLTDEQKKLLEKNKNKYREQTKTLFTRMRQKMDSLRQELEKSELNMQVIGQINNELKQLQSQMLDNRLEHILEVRKILTPGQFKEFEDKMNERLEHFKSERERARE